MVEVKMTASAAVRRPVLTVLVAALALAAASCDGEKKSRGIKYMPEMYDTPAFKSQQDMERLMPAAEAGKPALMHHIPAMLTAPAGTVSRDAAPYAIAATDWAAAKQLVNPLTPGAAVLRVGQRRFNITCAVCHGRDGDAAHGYVAPTKEHPDRFTGVPSLNGASLMGLSDGEIYHIVTLGRNRMPSLRAQVLPDERWAVVLYVRALNGASLAMSDAEARLAKLLAEHAEGGKPMDAYATSEIENAKKAVASKQRDLVLIQQGGDGADFAPPVAPQPEYAKPEWPEK